MGMKIGTYYYPEQWPREQWERDFDNIARMGLRIVHMGEFAWYSMEPREGEFQLDWLDECVTMAEKRGIELILCTPTAVPPVWLEDKHPDISIRDKHGLHVRHGGRRHGSPTSPAFIEASKRVTQALADRFAARKSVIGWQIDNEFNGSFDQNEHAHAAYRVWLRQRYGTIEKLNAAWGTQFWNTQYTSFDQIKLAAEREAIKGYNNPHEKLDASRFWSHAWAQFSKAQSDILWAALKPRVDEAKSAGTLPPFVTTNFMPFHLDINPADCAGDYNLFAWDSYPVSGWGKAMENEAYRLADPNGIEFTHDLMASFTGRWGLMEVQPGTVNWSGVPVLLYPGAVRLWLWTAWAHGSEFITVYRFRQPRFGTELFHHGLVQWDGVTPSEGGREFATVIDEIKKLDAAPLPTSTVVAAPPPEPVKKRRGLRSVVSAPPPAPTRVGPLPTVGLMYDHEQLWYYATLPQAKRWNQPTHVTNWYGAIARLGYKVKVLHPRDPIPADLPVVVAPGVQMVDPAWVSHWRAYAEQGGHLLLTARTALFDLTGQAWEGPTAQPIVDLIGATIEAYDGMPEDTWGNIDLDGQKLPWGVWGDLLYADETTRVLGRYADQFYAATAAVTQRSAGKGMVTYCGVYAEPVTADALFARVAKQAGLPVLPLTSRLRLGQRGRFKIALNYDCKAVEAPIPPGIEPIVGGRTLPPAGVAVWVE
jgi:beta-galactosidase